VPAIGAGQPAEEMVERAVLHHQDDDVADTPRAPGTNGARGVGDGLVEQVGAGDGDAGRSGRDLQELTAGKHPIMVGRKGRQKLSDSPTTAEIMAKSARAVLPGRDRPEEGPPGQGSAGGGRGPVTPLAARQPRDPRATFPQAPAVP